MFVGQARWGIRLKRKVKGGPKEVRGLAMLHNGYG